MQEGYMIMLLRTMGNTISLCVYSLVFDQRVLTNLEPWVEDFVNYRS